MSPGRHRQRGSVRLQAASSRAPSREPKRGFTLRRSGPPDRPLVEEKRAVDPGVPSAVPSASRHLSRAARRRDEGFLLPSPPAARDTSSRAVSLPPRVTPGWAPVASLDQGPSSASRPRRVWIRMRSIDVCHSHSDYEHPCSVISDKYPEVALGAPPEGSPVHASSPAVTGPGFLGRGVVFPCLRPVGPCHGHPCRRLAVPAPAFARETSPIRPRPASPHPRERCMASRIRGAFRLQGPFDRVALDATASPPRTAL